jgi:hypothetical protein
MGLVATHRGQASAVVLNAPARRAAAVLTSIRLAQRCVRVRAPREGRAGERTACAMATIARVIAAIRDANPLGGPNFQLRSVHACLVTSTRVEACAVVGTASQVRALVLRIDQRDTVWSCSMLALL